MASVASAGTSPLSGYEFQQTDSSTTTDGDNNENAWTLVSMAPSSGPGSSIGFFPSPAGSMNSWAIVDANGHMIHQPSPPPAVSPLALDYEQQHHQQHAQHQQSFQTAAAANAYTDQTAASFGIPAVPTGAQFMPNVPGQDAQNFMPPNGLLFDDNQLLFNDLTVFNSFPGLSGLEPGQPLITPDLDLSQASQHQQQHQHQQHQQQQQQQQQQQMGADAPWGPLNLKAGDSPIFVMEDPSFLSPSPPIQHSPSVSPPASASPRSPIQIKQEPGSMASGSGAGSLMSEYNKATTPISIRKVRGDARIQKRKSPGSESPSSASGSGSGSASSSMVGSASSSNSKFLIVTPDSVNAHAGKPNPWECFEAMRPSQRGRKGPLATDTKENALQVRRLGACFCCHARKVKCDKERPCRNCKKLTVAVPQVICWQFQDFIPVLFPDFIRGHFRKEEMARFLGDNIDSFRVEGAEKSCTVELFSGARFTTTLTVRAKFFTAKTPDVLQHWHLTVGRNRADLQSRGAAPIGLEMEGTAQRDELRRKAREYIAAIVAEPAYAEQVTDSLRHTEIPRRVLRIVQNYSYRCDAPIVKRALSIYAMHYVMTRHLCLTRQSIVNLGATKLVPQNVPWVTPRVLNRQLKSVIDEMLMREMQALFENFSKSLKPKSRKEWAPCLAAFLVLCLFMEAVESAADIFVISENEVSVRNRYPPPYKRAFALGINRELENLPFKQFAYQFHQIYQTHSRDASARSFNPLDENDDTCFQQAEMDHYAIQMVLQLRRLIHDRESWSELDFLTYDPLLPNQEDHPYPRDVTFNYTGRLVAKFLLSFKDEKYIFGPNSMAGSS